MGGGAKCSVGAAEIYRGVAKGVKSKNKAIGKRNVHESSWGRQCTHMRITVSKTLPSKQFYPSVGSTAMLLLHLCCSCVKKNVGWLKQSFVVNTKIF